ncbi:DUF2431 domain protein [Zea mays]|uniref:DUF2431 domain protein n=2 Tax=Zea mays TaxID=4577 RepID=A0A1D6IVG2_MAIZE|nr:DUF2431 domain protein [Zea mays]
MVLHGVDAKRMRFHTDLKNRRFDHIVFNFPRGGFRGKENDLPCTRSWCGVFFRNARHIVRQLGEVHVIHKSGEPYDSWDLEHLASESSFAMVDKVPFQREDYPGYNQKRGDGKRCNKPFDLGACCTFKFQIRNLKKLKQMNRRSRLIPNLGGSNFHPGHSVTDRGVFHPVAPVEARSWHHFSPLAHTGSMLMSPQPYTVNQCQRSGRCGSYPKPVESCHPVVSMPGPCLNDLPAQGGIPPPLPMSRIPSPDLLAPREQPWYQQRTILDHLGVDDYFFAREHQMSLQREYEMKRQVIPLEHRHTDRESVEKLEWLHRMITLYGRK